MSNLRFIAIIITSMTFIFTSSLYAQNHHSVIKKYQQEQKVKRMQRIQNIKHMKEVYKMEKKIQREQRVKKVYPHESAAFL